jgi:hypothetical protein
MICEQPRQVLDSVKRMCLSDVPTTVIGRVWSVITELWKFSRRTVSSKCHDTSGKDCVPGTSTRYRYTAGILVFPSP